MIFYAIAIVGLLACAAFYFLPNREKEYQAKADKEERARMLGDKYPFH